MSRIDGQLKRNHDDAIVVGVCAGLGDYFSVDATLVRAIFIAASVVGGFAPALYVVLWILLDDADRKRPELSATTAQVVVDTESADTTDDTHDTDSHVPLMPSMVRPRQ